MLWGRVNAYHQLVCSPKASAREKTVVARAKIFDRQYRDDFFSATRRGNHRVLEKVMVLGMTARTSASRKCPPLRMRKRFISLLF